MTAGVTAAAATGALDAAAEARVREGFALQGFLATIGAGLEEVAAGRIAISLRPSEAVSQQHGFVHGGVTAALLDTACGFAAMTLVPAGAEVLTVEYKVSFLLPTAGDRLVVVGEVVKPGRTLLFTEARAEAETAGERKTVARMSATIIAISGRDGVRPRNG